ncbi:hypothetical protein PV392_29210 [Streptomyces sp. ME03-5709C]|nr:hypothetical protein [Streptomyces sp. ME03-5709C]
MAGPDLATVASVWRAGRIIRASFLDRVRDAHSADPALPSLLADPGFARPCDGAHLVSCALKVTGTFERLGDRLPFRRANGMRCQVVSLFTPCPVGDMAQKCRSVAFWCLYSDATGWLTANIFRTTST